MWTEKRRETKQSFKKLSMGTSWGHFCNIKQLNLKTCPCVALLTPSIASDSPSRGPGMAASSQALGCWKSDLLSEGSRRSPPSHLWVENHSVGEAADLSSVLRFPRAFLRQSSELRVSLWITLLALACSIRWPQINAASGPLWLIGFHQTCVCFVML